MFLSVQSLTISNSHIPTKDKTWLFYPDFLQKITTRSWPW